MRRGKLSVHAILENEDLDWLDQQAEEFQPFVVGHDQMASIVIRYMRALVVKGFVKWELKDIQRLVRQCITDGNPR